MANSPNNIKWISAAVIVVAICASVWRCNDADWLHRRPVSDVPDTIRIKADTVFMDTSEVPQAVESKPVLVFQEPDTVLIHDPINPDTLSVVNEFFKKRSYIDTVLRGKFGGYVITRDTIYQNSLAARSVKANIRYPTFINKTITVRDTVKVDAEARTIFYFGGGLMGLPATGSLSVGLKLPNDTYIGLVTQKRFSDRDPIYGVEIKLPIKFKR